MQRSPVKVKIDYEAINTERIIENAALEWLRTLKVYILTLTLDHAYEYDAVIPKAHWHEEVEELIELEPDIYTLKAITDP